MTRQRDRRYYLEDIPLDEAIRRFFGALSDLGVLERSESEIISLDGANGRVTAKPVWAKVSSPHYDASAMDGVAVRSQDTVGATETSPIKLMIGEQASWVDTGDPMPDGFDSVIMVEVVHEIDDSSIEVQEPVPPYQHVRPLGEDIVATELVLTENHKMRPQDLAACAAAGLSEIEVRRVPRVVVIPTGTELVLAGTKPKPGDIIESNSVMLAAMVDEWGGSAERRLPVPDDFDLLKTAVMDSINTNDIVIVNAGSSAGSKDFTARLVEDLGMLLVHGVALRPGHPVVLGVIQDKPVLGIPGYSVSAAVTNELFVKPIIERKLGLPHQKRDTIKAAITRKVLSPIGEDEYLRVRLGRIGEKMVATPIQRGAGVIMSLVRADGLLLVPRFSEGIDAGDVVDVELLRPADDLEGVIVVTGSHDVTIDLLASEIRKAEPGLSLASSNVGSLGGLLALQRGEAHLAGCHLMDPETGEYNVSFVRRYVNGRDIVLMNLVKRVQGLIVQPGNPKKVLSLTDLIGEDVKFVNRQRGSGTRVLLDYMLKRQHVDTDMIRGYEREEVTHLGVAAAVSGGRADVGLGILSAARAMHMDFIPLLDEQYDLAIPAEFLQGDRLRPLTNVIQSPDFKRQVERLGGYDTSITGHMIAEINSVK